MKNLFYILMCCFAVSSVLADTSSELMNEKIHWSGEVITKAVEDGYKDYLYHKINSAHGSKEDHYRELDEAYEDKYNLLEALSKKGTFSLTDVVKQCTTYRTITPNYVCENVAKNFVDFISNPEWTEQTKTESKPAKKQQEEDSEQLCLEHNIKTYKPIQFENDDEFIYKSDMSYVNGMGYECDPGGSEDACAAGDTVSVSYGRFKRQRVEGVFRCVRGITGDKWERVEGEKAYPESHY